jgi:uncharacterized membrane protein YfcA
MDLFGLFPYDFAPWQLAALGFSSICFGMSKTGITGISVLAIPLFALIFGAKSSTGVILPLLCFADLFAVIYYRRHAEWKYVFRLIPWALAGFGLALFADHFIDSDRGFKLLMGICIVASLLVMFWNDLRLKNAQKAGLESGGITNSFWFSALFGILGGFSTMIGNTAGPILSVFMLSVRLPKESFVGTAAWFFLIVNYLKIPLQVFAWHNISLKTLQFDLFMIPFILLGIWLGILFVKKVTQSQYRIAVYALTLVSAVLLFI